MHKNFSLMQKMKMEIYETTETGLTAHLLLVLEKVTRWTQANNMHIHSSNLRERKLKVNIAR